MNPRLAKQGLHGPYCCSTAYLLGLMAPYVIAPITILKLKDMRPRVGIPWMLDFKLPSQ